MTVESKIGDVPGILALFLQISEHLGKSSPAIAAFTEVAKQRMPNMFGIGRTDEQLFEAIRQLLDAGKRHFIDFVVGEMKDYEKTIFRLTVTGMSCGNEMVPGTPVKNTVKGGPDIETKRSVSWEFTTKDLRVKYLDGIADEVAHLAVSSTEKLAAKQVVEAMRARRLITRSPSAQKAYELWIKTTKWVEKDILQLFGPEIKSFSDITPVMIAEKINLVASEIENRKAHPGSWKQYVYWKSVLLGGHGNRGLLIGLVLFGSVVAWQYYRMF